MCEAKQPAHCREEVTSLAFPVDTGQVGHPSDPQHPVHLSVRPQGRPYL